MGHSSSAATLRYQHVMAGRDAAIAAALDELIEPDRPWPSVHRQHRVARGWHESGNPAAARSVAEEKGKSVICCVVVVELRGFEPLTPCMPYTVRRPHHGRYG
jgi:hypothetical protein